MKHQTKKPRKPAAHKGKVVTVLPEHYAFGMSPEMFVSRRIMDVLILLNNVEILRQAEQHLPPGVSANLIVAQALLEDCQKIMTNWICIRAKQGKD